MPPRRGRVRLGTAAEQDFAAIIAWTTEQFGPDQTRGYRDIVLAAIGLLDQGPPVPGSIARNEIMHGLRTPHVARRGHPARHILLFREGKGMDIEVVRIPHDSMEIAIHLRCDDDAG